MGPNVDETLQFADTDHSEDRMGKDMSGHAGESSMKALGMQPGEA